MPAAKQNKGGKMEEHLRNYFLKLGCYVERGVPFQYQEFDVTDIDIWVYTRNSSLSREITLVDVKNKTTPKAIERIFWVNGLKEALSADKAIVATSDKREAVRDFGRKLNTLVLDGNFIQKISKSSAYTSDRLSEEEFTSLVDDYELSKLDGDWKNKLLFAKGGLVRGLNYNTCNQLLELGRFFCEQVIIKPVRKELALRCLYKICSYILICVDYIVKDIAFLEEAQRYEALIDGFTYGDKGSSGTKKILDTSLKLIGDYSKSGKSLIGELRSNIESEISSVRSSILAQYFSKMDVAKTAFAAALELEGASMHREPTHVSCLSREAKSNIFCLADYWELDRVALADSS